MVDHCRARPDEIHRVGDEVEVREARERSRRPYAKPPPAWT
jgi:hypothetical protein